MNRALTASMAPTQDTKVTSDLVQHYPIDEKLIERVGQENCIDLWALPWRKIGNTIYWVSSKKVNPLEIRRRIGTREKHRVVNVDEVWFNSLLQDYARDNLLSRAHERCPSEFAVRTANFSDSRLLFVGLISVTAALGLALPDIALLGVLGLIMIVVASATFVRLFAVIEHLSRPRLPVAQDAPILSEWPTITLLVPLYKEPRIVRTLIDNFEALQYPRDKLDIKLILEADDAQTLAAVRKIDLPINVSTVHVPPDRLRTKPKALNYAYHFCNSEIVGIYDAEDAPDPYQLRHVAAKFAEGDAQLAAVQCQLRFYNVKQNVLTRAFTIEYRNWFHMILPAFQRLGFPVPLGGTSVFLRCETLRKVGGWDAHNVTEDADLGVRLARFGYKTAVIDVETLEMANANTLSWIKQRSRWLKGYLICWLCHMRNPIRLKRELGWRGFTGVQILFLSGVAGYLALPLFWLLWADILGFQIANFKALPAWFQTMFAGTMFLAIIISFTMSTLALRAKEYRHLLPWVLTLMFYWPLGAIAAYKAMIELIIRPYHWEKTKHDRCAPVAGFASGKRQWSRSSLSPIPRKRVL